MPSALDREARLLDDLGANPAPLGSALRLSCRDIYPGQGAGSRGDGIARGDGRRDQLLEVRLFRRQGATARFGDPARFFMQSKGVEAHRACHRLAMGEAAVR